MEQLIRMAVLQTTVDTVELLLALLETCPEEKKPKVLEMVQRLTTMGASLSHA